MFAMTCGRLLFALAFAAIGALFAYLLVHHFGPVNPTERFSSRPIYFGSGSKVSRRSFGTVFLGEGNAQAQTPFRRDMKLFAGHSANSDRARSKRIYGLTHPRVN
jgi:hypothetical protein